MFDDNNLEIILCNGFKEKLKQSNFIKDLVSFIQNSVNSN